MSGSAQLSRPVPPQTLHTLFLHLDEQEQFLHRVCTTINTLQLSPRSGKTATIATELAQLQAESDRLRDRQQALEHQLRRWSGNTPVRLSQLPVPPDARERLDRRRNEVRALAARTAGCVKGLSGAISMWSELTRHALDTALGISPQESTYSACGTRVSRARPVLLDGRS